VPGALRRVFLAGHERRHRGFPAAQPA
jgi:hypothetical protein